jgi:acyl-CoA hydrolase
VAYGPPYAGPGPRHRNGLFQTDAPDELGAFDPADLVSRAIAGHIVRFLLEELAARRVPPEFLPVQCGVGNVAKAALKALGEDPDIPDFLVYTVELQPAGFELMRRGQLRAASTSALTLLPAQMQALAGQLDIFAPRLVLRPQEISNNPAVVVEAQGVDCQDGPAREHYQRSRTVPQAEASTGGQLGRRKGGRAAEVRS